MQNFFFFVSQMRVNTFKLPNRYIYKLKPHRKAILLLIPTLIFLTFIPLDYFHHNLLARKLRLAPPCWVVNSNDTARAGLSHKCDVFRGKWVPYPKGPYYTNDSACVIQDGQNCVRFGRPDAEFMKWRWKPDECELPLFDGAQFLEIVKGKSMAFVGDSVARNQMQSLGCLLSSVATYVDESSTKSDRGFRRWLYTDYNFTLTLMRTTHLVKARGVENYPNNPIDLYLDEVDDSWANLAGDFDYIIISSGHWFSKQLMYYEKGKVVGCSLCQQNNVKDLTMYYGYRMAFETAFRALLDHQNFKGTVLLRTFSPAHFEAEEREGRGNCVRTRPFTKQEMKFDWYIWMLRMIQQDQLRAAKREGRRERGRRLKFRLLDVTEAMRRRPDGHPNHYGHPPEKKKPVADCLHWCLPGPIDLWNELLLHMLKIEDGEGEGLK
ncbi:protein trichome birefringence-like 19 [Rhododendron vialii]|uniref:protein trichome birefringence-like 19 n=1 Tax=Rhododendron vialii TaxID=182163 RepID=UPI00265E3A2D|nr:protein trichome birefringence-like 19 [Rhododendron vialii]